MEFNKLVSLVLGFIVIVLLLVWVTGRLRGNSQKQIAGANVSVTPTQAPTPTKAPAKGWNPFGFLFNRATPTPTQTPAKEVAKNVTSTPAQQPTGMVTGTTQVTGTQNNLGAPANQQNMQNQNSGQAQYQTQNQNAQGYNVNGVTQIPNTGPGMLFPLAFSTLAGGIYLSRMKKD